VIAVDTNILVHAHREESQLHGRALARLTELAEGQALWGIPVFCLGEFLRIVTHARVFDPPSTVVEACEFLETLAESPSLRLLSPGARFLALLADAAREANAAGNLAFDAVIAAVCRESGAHELLTQDRDFARFTGVTAARL
jgi:uncharacterized protein